MQRFLSSSFRQMCVLGGLVLMLSFLGCQDDYVPTPRPHAFPRIELPNLATQPFIEYKSNNCPFTFSYPSGGQVVREEPDSCWLSLSFPAYNLTWHLTHRTVSGSGKQRAAHFEEYRRLVYKHSKKASRIEETYFEGPNGDGFFFEVYGEVGTPAQVFLAGPQEENLLMMSFYFQDATARDSLQPITQYMKEAFRQTLASVKWEGGA